MNRLRVDRLSEHLRTCKASTSPSVAAGSTPAQLQDVSDSEIEDEVANIMAKDQDPSEDASGGSGTRAGKSPFAPIRDGLSSPAPSLLSGPPAKRPMLATPSPSSSSLDGYFIKMTESDRTAICDKWAEFFLKNRLSFSLVDDPSFRAALEITRPNINGENGTKPLLTRNGKKIHGESRAT